MWKTLRGLGFVYANGNSHGGMGACRPTVCALCGGNGAGIGPYGYHAVLCRAGCPHPAVKAAASPTASP